MPTIHEGYAARGIEKEVVILTEQRLTEQLKK